MNYQTFNERLKNHVTALPIARKKELAIAICKKLFFDYQMFSDENNWGNPDKLLDAINYIQKSSIDKAETLSEARKLIAEVEAITPDTNDFVSCSYALNAAAAVWETLNFLLNNETEHIIACCTYLTDTIDFKIQEQDELTENQIDEHPDMIDARNFLLQFT